MIDWMQYTDWVLNGFFILGIIFLGAWLYIRFGELK